MLPRVLLTVTSTLLLVGALFANLNAAAAPMRAADPPLILAETREGNNAPRPEERSALNPLLGSAWWSGDTHIHGNGCGGNRTPDDMLSLISQADLNMGAALVWGVGFYTDVVYFTGADWPASTASHILHYDLEVSALPSDLMGHFIGLNLQNISFPKRLYTLPLAEWAKAQGAVTGYAHGNQWESGYTFPPTSTSVPHELPIDLALGKIDFLETEALPSPGFDFLWSSLLNSGFRLAIAGASDFPCGGIPVGGVRTWAEVEGPFTYANWVEAIRRGRTVVTAGGSDFMTMTVNGAPIGSELTLPAGTPSVSVQVFTALSATGVVEIMLNGAVVYTQTVPGGSGHVVSANVPITSSAWLAARAPRVQTGATYLLLGGRPIRASAHDAQYWVDYIDDLVNKVNSGAFARTDLTQTLIITDMAEAIPRYREAQDIFRQRAREAQENLYLPLVTRAGTPPTVTAPLSVSRYGIFEPTFRWNSASYSNPWEQVRLTLTLTSPTNGQVNVGGFFYLTDTWKVRYSPADVGAWSWHATLSDGSQATSASGAFTVTPSYQPGFVRRNPDNHNRWVFDDGTPYYPIGIGDCINDPFGTRWGFDGPLQTAPGAMETSTTTEVYLGAHSGAGINLFRWSVDNCAFGLYQFISPTVSGGNLYLMQRGLDGDTLVQQLRRHGIHTYMSIFGFFPPYPTDAADVAKMDAIKRYVKYVVDRYGAYVDFWELMNEYPNPPTAIDRDWYLQIGGYLKSIDPYAHPVSTSWPTNTVPLLDFTAPHWYVKENELESDLVTVNQIDFWKSYDGKAVIFGEQGNSDANWDERSALRMRIRSWTAFFNEAVLIFWNTSAIKVSPPITGNVAANLYIGPQERSHLQVLQNFVRELDAQLSMGGTSFGVSDPARVRGYALRSPTHYVAYLHAYTDHISPTAGISVTVDPLAAGMAQWVNPTTGSVVATQNVSSGLQSLSVPTFTVDIALKIAPP